MDVCALTNAGILAKPLRQFIWRKLTADAISQPRCKTTNTHSKIFKCGVFTTRRGHCRTSRFSWEKNTAADV